MHRTLLATLLLTGCAATPAPPAAGPTLHEIDHAGTVRGPNLAVASLNPDFVELHVPPDTRDLDVSLHATSGAAYAYLFAPSCDALACAQRLDSDGTGAHLPTPEPGAWQLHVAKGDPGTSAVDYELRFRAIVARGAALAAREGTAPAT